MKDKESKYFKKRFIFKISLSSSIIDLLSLYRRWSMTKINDDLARKYQYASFMHEVIRAVSSNLKRQDDLVAKATAPKLEQMARELGVTIEDCILLILLEELSRRATVIEDELVLSKKTEEAVRSQRPPLLVC